MPITYKTGFYDKSTTFKFAIRYSAVQIKVEYLLIFSKYYSLAVTLQNFKEANNRLYLLS